MSPNDQFIELILSVIGTLASGIVTATIEALFSIVLVPLLEAIFQGIGLGGTPA